MRKQPVDMLEGPLLRNVLRYTLPIIFTNVLQLLFNAADLIVVGQFCSSYSVGAVGATSILSALIVQLFIGLSIGAGVAASQAIGSGNRDAIHRTVHTAIPVAAVSGAVITAVGIPLAPYMLAWMDTPIEYIDLSVLYLQIYFAGMIPMMVFNFAAAMLRAAGDTRSPMIHLTIAGAFNVVMNVIFITVFHMDVDGVALATALSQILAAFLELRTLRRRQDNCRLNWHCLQFHKASLWRMIRVGIPAGIQGSLFCISTLLIQSAINGFGPEVGAGNAAGNSVEGFSYTIMTAFQQTALNFTGQNIGARNYTRVRRVLTMCMLCVTGCGLLFGSLVCLAGEPLLWLYLKDSPEAVSHGMLRLIVLCLPHFLCGNMEVVTGVIRGMGVSLAPTIVTVLFICVFRLCWVWWIFPRLGGTLEALYASFPVSWAFNLLALLVIYAVVIHRQMQSLQSKGV